LLAGWQGSKHLAFDASGNQIASVGPFCDYPCYAWFNTDGSVAAFNACLMYGGTSVGVSVSDLPGLDTDFFEKDHKIHLLEDDSRVYAAVARDDEFIIGDANGYLRAFDLQGGFRWQHFIGGTITALDLSLDKHRLAVATRAGFLCVLRLDTGRRDPFTIGTASHKEVERLLFWKQEERILRW